MKTCYAAVVVGIVSGACLAPDACGQLLSESYHFTTAPLPITPVDGSGSPSSDTRVISGSQIGVITDVNISFTLANAAQGGGFNGDYYMTLQHSSGLAVLLNRVGRRAFADPDNPMGEDFGYSDNGFNITLDDQAVNGDIHVYRATLAGGDHTVPVDVNFRQPLTGVWAPDGRTESPLTVLASSPRTAQLSVFNNLPVNGSWTLQLVDLNSGGTARLTDWNISITGVVPEPAETAAMAGGALIAFAAIRRRWRKTRSL